ncbi:deoxynucleotidyltransferase terminal-interacting protein 2 [Carcharodon carcharias]|uniref:deoxynucleotidyltransferase terminal-interacting protein 2 n=1 Tax=Carcharodon carcharias TaxID=13397 RepID=UPI001B7E0F65|nr:deoxynucleotidyltransferase terminal-interacting protein 2 [Carcharodon carcharias]
MVQTRSGRQTQGGKVEAGEEAESRLRTPVSRRKTRSSRVETQSESITESQPEEQKIVGEQQIVHAESQPCPEQPIELNDRLGENDQCSESNIIESNPETEKEKPDETEIHEINLIEIVGETSLDYETQSATPATICLLLSSDEDKGTLEDGDNDMLEESNTDVISGPVVSSEPSAIPPDTTGSPLAKDRELFVIDKQPGIDQDRKYYLDLSEKEESGEEQEESSESGEEPGDRDESEKEGDDDDFIDEDEDEDDDILKTKSSLIESSSSIDPGLSLKELGGLYICFDPDKQGSNSKAFKKLKEQKKNDELLANTILTPEFEKQECVPPLKESIRQLKKKHREERAKTTGDGWYNMKAPDLTDELKNDLRALKMRAAINPKRFYKKNDREGFPKYFQVGKVLDNPVDFYHSRIPKKQRKRTMVEELLADVEFRRYNKKKYQQIITEKAALVAGKKNRKKMKFKK